MDTKFIEISKINNNSLNNRSMNEEDIRILADNIEINGLLEKPVVYLDYPSENDYVLLSGHRRVAALKILLKNGKLKSDKIECFVYPEPLDTTSMIEMMASFNNKRSRPEEMVTEFKNARDAWATLKTSTDPAAKEKYNKLVEKFKKDFIKRNDNNSRYLENPDEYIRNSFRPREDYVRMITGIDVSNSTIKRIIREIDAEESGENTNISKEEKQATQPKEKEKKEKTPKMISKKDIMHTMSILSGQIAVFLNSPLSIEDEDKSIIYELGALQESANTLIDSWGKR